MGCIYPPKKIFDGDDTSRKKDHWIMKIYIKINKKGTALEITHQRFHSHFYYNGTINLIFCNYTFSSIFHLENS